MPRHQEDAASAAAHRIADNDVIPHTRKLYHRGGKRFAQRRDTGNSTVAALMQRNTGGIEHYRGNIVQNEKFYPVFDTRFLEAFEPVTAVHRGDGGTLDNTLAIRNGKQL